MFLDGPGAKARDAVHIIFAGEKARSIDVLPTPRFEDARITKSVRVIALEALVRMKLTAFLRNGQVHILDMIDVGLVNRGWVNRFPPSLATRLTELLDNPGG